MTKVVSLTIRNRAAAILFIAALLALGAVFLTVGLALLAGLALAGGVVGIGMAAYRMLTGGHRRVGERGFGSLSQRTEARLSGLDPSLEVSPTRPAVIRPADRVDGQLPPAAGS
jgi:hypothetical protein